MGTRRPIALIVEDDPHIVRYVRMALEAEDFQVLAVGNGLAALDVLDQQPINLILLDLGLPGLSGYDLCREIRRISAVPIIIITGRTDEEDKVQGLDLGADDYLTKPFGVRELLARVRAVLRRTQSGGPTLSVLACGDLEIDLQARAVSRQGEQIPLTPTEFNLLVLFAKNRGRLLRPAELLHHIWGGPFINDRHLLRVNIARLRKKIGDDPAHPRYIMTRPGSGYLMPRE